MYAYYTLWRRKRMRCVIVGCLGMSVLVSVMMVMGSPAMNAIEDEDTRGLRDYKGLVTPKRNDKGLQLSFGGNHGRAGRLEEAQLGKTLHTADSLRIKHTDGTRDGGQRRTGDGYDDPGDNNDSYDDGEDNDPGNSYYDNGNQETLDIRHILEEQKDDGFVMEDNAADYNQENNDDEYDYEDEDDGDNDGNPPFNDGNPPFNDGNPPFKPGDFDYSLLNPTEKATVPLKSANVAVEAKHTNLKEIRENLKPNNGSHLYNKVQYKTMHLLENTIEKEQTGQRLQNNSKGHFQKLRLVHVIQQSNKSVMDSAETKIRDLSRHRDHKPPCFGASNCRFSDTARKTEAPGGLQYNNAKDVANTIQHADIHRPGSRPIGDQKRVQHRERINNKLDTNVRQSSQPYKDRYGKGFVPNNAKTGQISQSNQFIGQNVIFRQRIETQIPIQDGRVDANWLLQEPPATQIQMPELPWQPGEVRSPEGIPLIVDKIYWSHEVEDLIPQGITNEDFQHFLHKLNSNAVKEMHAPQWNRCGRPSNQYLVLRDDTKLCARFREEHVKLLHGEVLSFYFSRILGLDNVPIVVLSEANSAAPQWLGMNITGAGWNESSVVALIQWIDGLESEKSRVRMPAAILQAYEDGSVFDHHHKGVHHLQANNLTELVQWSDMILFDYLTGHYDRVASMQDGADREQKPSIMHESIRNLRKVWQSSKMWLIDNESGLFDGYELLYQGGEMGRKFVEFHAQMLRTNCIFRRRTVDKIFQLASLSSPHDVLVRYASAQDTLYQHLPYTKEIQLFKKYLPVRLKQVVDWIKKCQTR